MTLPLKVQLINAGLLSSLHRPTPTPHPSAPVAMFSMKEQPCRVGELSLLYMPYPYQVEVLAVNTQSTKSGLESRMYAPPPDHSHASTSPLSS